MATNKYGKFKSIADNLLTKWGMTITLTDVSRNELGTFIGIKSPVRIENTPDTVLQRSTATVYMTAGTVEPLQNQYITMDGQDYIIIHVEPARPTDTTILYTLFVSNGG